ncbi:pantothenate permease [Siminovitchia terrae]|uniref:Pantothenate permease n=1 Tax=Siminovitchia terrae TaxID=1914933 RepID=A0A429X7W9_SIMTE|nr:sodium:solute symporter family protein [Siminovitchia terrae]RST59538.1 sodium:solute symporter family protein [Siminovitchia terrae]GIN99042.1 pantothenate permease [Siminovitchia terrae]
MSLPTMVFVFLGISMIVYLFICYLGYRATDQSSMDDFYLGGRDLGPIVLFLTIGASWFSMWFLLGAPGSFFLHGVGFNSFFILNIVLGVFMFVFGRRMWALAKVYNYVTPSDMLEHYYNSRFTRLISSVIGMYLLFPYIGIQLLGAGVAFELIGSSFWLGVGSMLVLVTLYSLVGGMKAVAWTDAVQGVFYMLLTWGLAFWMLSKGVTGIGSLGNLFSAVNDNFPDFLKYPGSSGYFTPLNWFAYIAIYVTAGIGLPHLWTRYYMAKDMSAFKVVPLGHVLFASWGFVPILIVGMLGKLFLPDIEVVDQIFPAIVLEYSPVLAVVLITAAFAAAMSTVDSQLMAMGTIFTKDIWEVFIKKENSEKTLVWVGRISMVILMAISVVWTLYAEGSIVALSMIAFTCGSLLFMPLFGVLFYPKAGKYAANISLIAGFLTLLFTTYIVRDPGGIYGGGYALLIQVILFFIIAQIEKNHLKERTIAYHSITQKCINGDFQPSNKEDYHNIKNVAESQ